LFDFGDGNTTGWIGPFESGSSGDPIEVSHTWAQPGVYEVKAKTKNTVEAESAYSNPLEIHISRLKIGSVTGGLARISAEIENVGTISKNVEWEIKFYGGTFPLLHINKHFNGSLWVKSGNTVIVQASPLFSIGRIKIEITAECSGEPIVTKTVDGLAFLFYIMIQ
jgi:hypothetical protein